MRLKEIIKISIHSFRRDGVSALINLSSAYFNSHREPLKMSSGPLLIQIEPTLHCNLKCSMCINPISGRKKRHMRFDEFRKILDSIHSVCKISLVGAGETLLNPEIFEMISYAKSKGILIGFATNGMLLSEDICQKIINTRVGWVNISIDSADKDKFEAIRQGADFDIFLNNIKRIVEIKGNNKLPEISLWFVIMENNLSELIPVIRLAKNLRIKEVLSQLQHCWGNEHFKNNASELEIRHFYEEVKSTLKYARTVAGEVKVHFDYVNIPDNSLGRSCKWPWRSCYITADGFVTPCCIHGTDPGILNFGNIFEEKFNDIWNNKLYQNFRQQLKSNAIPPLCIGCPSYYRKI